ncbi:MAG: hypothetical protein AAB459_03400 [Patescibacteria group bacterium]
MTTGENWFSLPHDVEFPGWAERMILNGASSKTIDGHINTAQRLYELSKRGAAEAYLQALGIPTSVLVEVKPVYDENGYPTAELISRAQAARENLTPGELLPTAFSDALFFEGDSQVTDGK